MVDMPKCTGAWILALWTHNLLLGIPINCMEDAPPMAYSDDMSDPPAASLKSETCTRSAPTPARSPASTTASDTGCVDRIDSAAAVRRAWSSPGPRASFPAASEAADPEADAAAELPSRPARPPSVAATPFRLNSEALLLAKLLPLLVLLALELLRLLVLLEPFLLPVLPAGPGAEMDVQTRDPVVSVPVLSKATVPHRDSASSTRPPLIRMPLFGRLLRGSE